MADLAIEQRSQAVPAGNAVEKFIRANILLQGPGGGPFRELAERAPPHDLFFLVFNTAEAVFIQRKRIRAPQQGTPARPLPFAIFLLQLPWFDLATAPAKILRRHTMESGESRYSESRQNLRRN